MHVVVAPLPSTHTGAVRSHAVSGGFEEWERSLVARVVAGDDTALATIYDQFGALVFGIAARLVGRDTAPDISQEVFSALWDHPERFDAARGSLRTFLAVMCRRRCIDHLRRHGRRAANEERAVLSTPAASPNVDEAAMAMIAGERIRIAMAGLPQPQRQALELAYFEGLTFRQVASATGASEGTAKSRIRLGLQRLAQELRTNGEVELA